MAIHMVLDVVIVIVIVIVGTKVTFSIGLLIVFVF